MKPGNSALPDGSASLLHEQDPPGGGTRISGLSVGLAFIRRNSCCVALGFALGQFLLLLLLFFLGPCAGRPVSLRSISTVVWLECHRILLGAG